jgi:DNA repair protein NreA
MGGLKSAFLKKITSSLAMRPKMVSRELAGSTPPSIFIGSWNYPKVYAGPLMSGERTGSELMDTPEGWIPGGMGVSDIISFRTNLVRGKWVADIKDTEGKMAQMLRDIALCEKSVTSDALFKSEPRGATISEDMHPHGPSAMLEKLELGNGKWEHSLEKAHYDTDLGAGRAVSSLYSAGLDFSKIEKAFSAGTLGVGRNRKLVPTKWSITACDSTIGDMLLEEVRRLPTIENYRVHYFRSLENAYAVILLPTAWQYEWTEAFINVLRGKTMIFSDYETNRGKKEYSSVGGCYYSCKMALLEGMKRMGVQAGALVWREAYPNYVPLGVFNVRENMRHAMRSVHSEFGSLREAMAHVSRLMHLRPERFIGAGYLAGEILKGRQTGLKGFMN